MSTAQLDHADRDNRGESGIGTWTVIVRDTKVNEFNGTWIDWHLKLWGESIDASKATVLPLPKEDDDDDHDVIATTTIPPTVVTPPPSVVSPPTDGSPPGNPTDHPDRPTKPTGDVDPGELETSPNATATAVPGSSWLPGFLPTFGVGPRAQAWIYASLALILVFCAGLGVYLFMARRKRLRNSPRDTYEFELLDEEEAEGLTAGVEKDGTSSGKKRTTRGGELYDAFAGGSDDEEEFYRDNVEGGSSGSGSDGARREKRALAGDEDEQHVLGSDSEDEGDEGDEREGLRAGGH